MSENQDNKKQLVEEVVTIIQETGGEQVNTFVLNYSSITSGEMNDLRGALIENGANMKIVKNTLILRVLEGLGIDTSGVELEGQNALLITGEDFITPLKSLFEFVKQNEKGEVQLGVLNGVVISATDVNELSKLPSKEELIAKVVGGFSSPIRGFVYVLNGVQGDFVRVLNAIKEQKGE